MTNKESDVDRLENEKTIEELKANFKEGYKQAILDGKTNYSRPEGELISKEEALKIMCERCPVYNCVSACNSYRCIEKMSSVILYPSKENKDV